MDNTEALNPHGSRYNQDTILLLVCDLISAPRLSEVRAWRRISTMKISRHNENSFNRIFSLIFSPLRECVSVDKVFWENTFEYTEVDCFGFSVVQYEQEGCRMNNVYLNTKYN